MTSDSPPKAHRVFVSYVLEDQVTVERLAKELSAYGIKVWLDKTELKPGIRWRDAIREAISQGDFFIACFSEAYQRRSKSELLAANKCPDFVEDKGHYLGTNLPESDKRALIECMKTF